MADGAREVMFVKECEGCRIEVHYGVFHHVIILCTANLLRWLSIVWEWLQEKSGMNEKPLKDINWRNQRLDWFGNNHRKWGKSHDWINSMEK